MKNNDATKMNSETNGNKRRYWDTFYSIDFEKIVDHPNILIAARFWEENKYRAAKNCYKFMRAIDDLIDNYKTEHQTIAPDDKPLFEAEVHTWINRILHSGENANPMCNDVIETIRTFQIPFWPFEDFARSMIYDIYHDGFPTFPAFLDYAVGASVAPASIFVHLCGLRYQEGAYLLPAFSVKEAAAPCAIFSYLVHIIRDFMKDHRNHLNYFPDDLLMKYNLDREKLRCMAQGGEITRDFRECIRELYIEADKYRLKTKEVIREIGPLLEPCSRLSLEIIFGLYTLVFDRIDWEEGGFTTEELNPTAAEVKEHVRQIILHFEENHPL